MMNRGDAVTWKGSTGKILCGRLVAFTRGGAPIVRQYQPTKNTYGMPQVLGKDELEPYTGFHMR